MRRFLALLVLAPVALALATGCRSPFYADRGALFGGLTGAGVGAAIGDATGHAGAGAAIGSAVGALTGAAVGETIDADLARSRAEIEAKMGRQMQGAVTAQDVVAMTQAGLSDEVITTHIRANGTAQPLAVNDLINLRNMGVRDSVINAMQQTPPRTAQAVPGYYPGYPPPGGQVVVEQVYAPWYPPPPAFYYGYGRRPHGRASWGFSMWR